MNGAIQTAAPAAPAPVDDGLGFIEDKPAAPAAPDDGLGFVEDTPVVAGDPEHPVQQVDLKDLFSVKPDAISQALPSKQRQEFEAQGLKIGPKDANMQYARQLMPGFDFGEIQKHWDTIRPALAKYRFNTEQPDISDEGLHQLIAKNYKEQDLAFTNEGATASTTKQFELGMRSLGAVAGLESRNLYDDYLTHIFSGGTEGFEDAFGSGKKILPHWASSTFDKLKMPTPEDAANFWMQGQEDIERQPWTPDIGDDYGMTKAQWDARPKPLTKGGYNKQIVFGKGPGMFEIPDIPGLGFGNPAMLAMVGDQIKPIWDSFYSPAGLALAIVGGPASAEAKVGSVVAGRFVRGISGFFSAQMLWVAADQAPEVMRILKDPKATLRDKAKVVGNEMVTLGFALLSLLHLNGEIMENDKRRAIAGANGHTTPEAAEAYWRKQANDVTNTPAQQSSAEKLADALYKLTEAARAQREKLRSTPKVSTVEEKPVAQPELTSQERADRATIAFDAGWSIEPPPPPTPEPFKPGKINSGFYEHWTTLEQLVGEWVEYAGYEGVLLRDSEGNFILRRPDFDRGGVRGFTEKQAVPDVEVENTGKDSQMLATEAGIKPKGDWAEMPTGTRPHETAPVVSEEGGHTVTNGDGQLVEIAEDSSEGQEAVEANDTKVALAEQEARIEAIKNQGRTPSPVITEKPVTPAPVMEPPKPAPAPVSTGTTTPLKNAATDQKLEESNQPKTTPPEPFSNEEEARVGNARIRKDPGVIKQLLDELTKKMRGLDVTKGEGTILRAAFQEANDALNEAGNHTQDVIEHGGTPEEIAAAEAAEEAARAEQRRIADLRRETGTMTGRALQIRTSEEVVDPVTGQADPRKITQASVEEKLSESGKPLTKEDIAFAKAMGAAADKLMREQGKPVSSPVTRLTAWLDSEINRIESEAKLPKARGSLFGADLVGELGYYVALRGAKILVNGVRDFHEFGMKLQREVGAMDWKDITQMYQHSLSIARRDPAERFQYEQDRLTNKQLRSVGATRVEIGPFEGSKLGGKKVDESAPKIVLNPKGAVKFQQAHDAIDVALADALKDPSMGLDNEGWLRFFARALNGSTGTIPPAPLGLERWVTNPESFRKFIYDGLARNPDLVQSAIGGLDALGPIHEQAMRGKIHPKMVALHMFWGLMSRMLDPYNQEAGWGRLTSDPKILRTIEDSVNGKYNLTKDEWNALVGDKLREARSYVADTGKTKKTPGNNARQNANAFHAMLKKWNGRWQELADIVNNPDLTGPQMRREMAIRGFGGAGIKHKVTSFVLATLTRMDMFVGDRWQVVNLWMPHLREVAARRAIEGGNPEVFEKDKRGVPEDSTQAYKNIGKLLNHDTVAEAAYRLIEQAMEKIAADNPWLEEMLGHKPSAFDIHWLTWNIIKDEPVGHSSLEATADFLNRGRYESPTFPEEFAGAAKTTEKYSRGGYDRFTAQGSEKPVFGRRESEHGAAGGAGGVADAAGSEGGSAGSRLQRIRDYLHPDNAEARLRSGKVLSFSPADLLDLSIVAARDAVRGVKNTAEWAKSMVDRYGPEVQQHLPMIWKNAQELIRQKKSEFRREQYQRNRSVEAAQILQRGDETGDYSHEKRAKPEMTEEIKQQQIQANRLWAQVETAAERKRQEALRETSPGTWYVDRATDVFNKVETTMAITGYHTLAKLAAFTGTSLINAPLETAAAMALRHAPLGVGEIFRRAEFEGAASLESLAHQYKTTFTKGIPDAWQQLTTGTTDNKLFYEKPSPNAVTFIDYIGGNTHTALKTPLRTGVFEKYLMEGEAQAKKIFTEEEMNNATVRFAIAQRAWQASAASILAENGGFQQFVKDVVGKATNNKSVYIRTIARVAEALTTKKIYRIPANYLQQTLERNPVGLLRLGVEAATKSGVFDPEMRAAGVKMSPQQAQVIAHLIKVGAVGSAFSLWGFWDGLMNDDKDRNFGGYYTPGTRGSKDVPPAMVRFGGIVLPHLLIHNPYFESAQLSNTMGRMIRASVKKNPDAGVLATLKGMLVAFHGILMQAPGASTLLRADPRTGDNFITSLIKGAIIPQIISNIAEDQDTGPSGHVIKRETKTIKQAIQSGLPETPLGRGRKGLPMSRKQSFNDIRRGADGRISGATLQRGDRSFNFHTIHRDEKTGQIVSADVALT